VQEQTAHVEMRMNVKVARIAALVRLTVRTSLEATSAGADRVILVTGRRAKILMSVTYVLTHVPSAKLVKTRPVDTAVLVLPGSS